MSFKDLDLDIIYNTDSGDVIKTLIIPLLKKSKKYYRGVGYFTSNWIKLCLMGIVPLIENDGKIYLLTSPELSEDDWKAIERAEDLKKQRLVEDKLLVTLNKNLDMNSKEKVLNYFSWLLADNFIEMKIVVCKRQYGNYHDKLAIFEDFQGNKVCTHGSMNDSLKATFNGEGISVFKSWESSIDYVERHHFEFNKIWNNDNAYYKVYPIGQFLREEILKYKKYERPYKIKKNKLLSLPYYVEELKEYQKIAVENIKINNWIGLLEMATGTGKTITGLSVSKDYYEKFERIFLLVLVPYKHLVTQWEKNIVEFGYTNIVKCFDSKEKWLGKLNDTIRSYNSGIKSIACVISTYDSATSSEFLSLTKKIKNHSFLLADECHNLGSSKNQMITHNNFTARIGLSATPQRWFDDSGTDIIKKYFVKTVFEYTLENAIKNGFLVNYKYFPTIIRLTDEENDYYNELSEKIAKVMRIKESERPKNILESLVRKRSLIVKNAQNKLPAFLELIREQKKKGFIKNTLVYCSAGDNNRITKLISELGIKVHQITYNETLSERESILKRFSNGEIEVLVAIKCLDEGVDIPSTEIAYFLASTSNPREFVQRRGRILRTFKGKISSSIYDFIVFPSLNIDSKIGVLYENNKKIISKEMPRFAEFSLYSINRFYSREIIRNYLREYNLEYLMDKLPWDVYNEMKEEFFDEKNAY